MIKPTLDKTSALQFTSLQICHFPPLLDVSLPGFKSLHFTSLTVTFLNRILTTRGLQGKDACASAGSWFQSLMVLFTKDHFPISVLCFLALIFRSWSSLLRSHGHCDLSPIAFLARSPVDVLTRAVVQLHNMSCPRTRSYRCAVCITGSGAGRGPELARWGWRHSVALCCEPRTRGDRTLAVASRSSPRLGQVREEPHQRRRWESADGGVYDVGVDRPPQPAVRPGPHTLFCFSAWTSSFNMVPPPTITNLDTSQRDAVAARASRRRRWVVLLGVAFRTEQRHVQLGEACEPLSVTLLCLLLRLWR